MCTIDAEIAPVWDPIRKVFIALMGVRDYIQMLYISKVRNIPFTELLSRSILDMLHPSLGAFLHPDFQPVDAEDTVYQLCLQFIKSDVDYIPVVDPDTGNLVAVLGDLDIIFLLSQISQEFPNLFSFTIEQLVIGHFVDQLTAPASTLMVEVLRVMNDRMLKYVPVLEDGSRKFVGLYQRSNISFITKATESDDAIKGFAEHRIGDVVRAEVITPLIDPSRPGDAAPVVTTGFVPAGSSAGQGASCTFLTCTLKHPLKSVIESMVTMRCCAVTCVDDHGNFLGVISSRDILHYYCHNS